MQHSSDRSVDEEVTHLITVARLQVESAARLFEAARQLLEDDQKEP